MRTVLEARDVAVHFQGRGGLFSSPRPPVKAVDGVDLTIAAGETLGLVGESGCGKSTLSNAIVGLLAPTRGSIRIHDRDVVGADAARLRDIRRDVQMIFQDPLLSLDPRARIGAAIAEPLAVHGLRAGTDLRERVVDLLTQVGLRPEHRLRFPHQLSGGQRQRVAIARALALEPALVVCDEPVSALDVSVRAQILNLLVSLQKRSAIAYLFVSHDLAVVRHISDRVAVMYLGRIVEQASRDQFFAGPLHPYSQALMAAVLQADPTAQRNRRQLPQGELANAAALPVGCAFHPRCPRATEICKTDRPELLARADGVLVACHHVDDRAAI